MTKFNRHLVSSYSDEMFDMDFECVITSVNGTLIAEVNGYKYWETVDVASKLSYGDTFEVGYFSDGWHLVDFLECVAY